MVNMKNIKLFEEFQDNDLEEIRDLFIEISDMRYYHYSIRNADMSTYKKVTDLIVKKTNGGNILVDIFCDYLYVYAIQKEIKDNIYPRIKSMGYRVINTKKINTGEQIEKKVPISGRDALATVYDPLIKISVLITKS